jgi:polyphosphate glucokinase
MIGERLRVETSYPMTPDALVAALVKLVKPAGQFNRVSVAFPGVVRRGIVLSAPHFVTKKGPGSAISADLVKAWDHFDLDGALTKALRKPTRVINDADMQGLDVMTGKGVELVITLGTGMGNAVFSNGVLGPRLELSVASGCGSPVLRIDDRAV